MAKGRFKHVSSAKKEVERPKKATSFRELPYDEEAAVKRSAGEVSTTHTASPLLMTLLFDEKAVQHAAMSRIEAFYEANKESERQYLTLEQAKERRICLNYEAFNCPITCVVQWLNAMKTYHESVDGCLSASQLDDQPFWAPYVNECEAFLLQHLIDRQCVAFDEEIAGLFVLPSASSPRYMVTALTSQAHASLAHEQLHFLHFVSPDYREQVRISYETLTSKTRKIIETDLALRKYAEHVWSDEFQAYISEDAGEFGAKTLAECAPIRTRLRSLQHRLWRELAAKRA
jgi:hypothetical protein